LLTYIFDYQHHENTESLYQETLLSKRSQNFRNVYNSETGFMSARNYDGSFLTDVGSHVDEVEQVVEEGITEGGRWTYLFCAMQDVPGLISLIGGKDKFTNMSNDLLQ